MTGNEPVPLKNISLCLLLIGTGGLLAAVFLIALVSIRVGLTQVQQDGFWVPVLAGTVSIIGCLWIFLFIVRTVLDKMKEKETIQHI